MLQRKKGETMVSWAGAWFRGRATMASDMATRRLRKELMAIKRTPVDNIVAAPLESNILEWHYVITGTKGSPYEGGFYHGKLKFPPEYPMKPPSVMMLTPNGRFACSRRLCLSMSDFHPESWNPMWSVSTILMGLYSFMLDTTATLGSVTSTTAQKKKFAAESLEFNCKNSAFRKLFPDLVELNERRKQNTSTQGGSLANQNASSSRGGGGSNNSRGNSTGKVSAGGSRAGGVPPKAGGGGEDRGKTGIWGITFLWLSLVVAVGMMIVAYVLRPSLEG